MPSPAVVERTAQRDAEPVVRKWACTARPAQRRGQRGDVQHPIKQVFVYLATAVGVVVAAPIALICALVVALPFIFVILWLGLLVLGVSGGGTSVGD
jgi:lipopolysaccharide/colanic/teichoic acid biosynthesis glycosyltransferase